MTRCLDTYDVRQKRQKFDSGCDGGEVQHEVAQRKSKILPKRSSSQQHNGENGKRFTPYNNVYSIASRQMLHYDLSMSI